MILTLGYRASRKFLIDDIGWNVAELEAVSQIKMIYTWQKPLTKSYESEWS